MFLSGHCWLSSIVQRGGENISRYFRRNPPWPEVMVLCSMRYLDWGLVQMTQVGCCLSWFMTQHHHVGVDQSEGINNNLKKWGAHIRPDYRKVGHFKIFVNALYFFSIFTFPLTLWMGSTTTATARSDRASKLCCVLMSTPDNQQPNPGWLWYHPTTISGLMSHKGGRKKLICLKGIHRRVYVDKRHVSFQK